MNENSKQKYNVLSANRCRDWERPDPLGILSAHRKRGVMVQGDGGGTRTHSAKSRAVRKVPYAQNHGASGKTQLFPLTRWCILLIDIRNTEGHRAKATEYYRTKVQPHTYR